MDKFSHKIHKSTRQGFTYKLQKISGLKVLGFVVTQLYAE